ncbi:uncharacterized protein B0H18DRAFT_139486 [Fomitopsis serialis]|uniref:uncharacterized protein n=1 Tax=Fomitopsis serialis TaxID=139415 RepID=UPI002007DCAB|nr:uncharacterized protein B0H18DRAFT_139486 [Neoantrodia serialis]KAH9914273.1 hypothetical protein B0H18DRAFT_139486 [Neoantrodia serialis]
MRTDAAGLRRNPARPVSAKCALVRVLPKEATPRASKLAGNLRHAPLHPPGRLANGLRHSNTAHTRAASTHGKGPARKPSRRRHRGPGRSDELTTGVDDEYTASVNDERTAGTNERLAGMGEGEVEGEVEGQSQDAVTCSATRTTTASTQGQCPACRHGRRTSGARTGRRTGRPRACRANAQHASTADERIARGSAKDGRQRRGQGRGVRNTRQLRARRTNVQCTDAVDERAHR